MNSMINGRDYNRPIMAVGIAAIASVVVMYLLERIF